MKYYLLVNFAIEFLILVIIIIVIIPQNMLFVSYRLNIIY